MSALLSLNSICAKKCDLLVRLARWEVDFPISEVVLSCKGWKSAVEVLDPEALADWGQ